jgi:hypothetical protein
VAVTHRVIIDKAEEMTKRELENATTRVLMACLERS